MIFCFVEPPRMLWFPGEYSAHAEQYPFVFTISQSVYAEFWQGIANSIHGSTLRGFHGRVAEFLAWHSMLFFFFPFSFPGPISVNYGVLLLHTMGLPPRHPVVVFLGNPKAVGKKGKIADGNHEYWCLPCFLGSRGPELLGSSFFLGGTCHLLETSKG